MSLCTGFSRVAQLRAFVAIRDRMPRPSGLGDSAALTAPDTIEDHARTVLDLIDGQGIAEFDVLGHFMRGMLVQERARLAPERVRSLESLWRRG